MEEVIAMTVDVSKIRYGVTASLSNGRTIEVINACENLGWEENSGEFSARANITLRDIEFEGTRLALLFPLCTKIYINADLGFGVNEMWRGTIWEWEFSGTPGDNVIITGYDMLYALQKSSDNRYYAKGKKTKSIIENVANAWNFQIGDYKGPDVKHAKLLFKNKKVSSIIQGILDDAQERGAEKSFARASRGRMDIVQYGQNDDVYCFSAENLSGIKNKYSMTDLVTRVVITGKEDSKGRPKVVAAINGKTQYGILQSIQSKGSDSLAAAKKSAQKLLKEKGSPKHTLRLESPDVPVIRKGDRISLSVNQFKGYYYVTGVAHNATQGTMNMEVEEIV